MNKWQPMETAPKDGSEILIWSGCSQYVASYGWVDEDGESLWFNGDVAVNATHWMPLPDAPHD